MFELSKEKNMRFTKPVVIAGFATLAAIGTLFVL
jgi:hypothetical protein